MSDRLAAQRSEMGQPIAAAPAGASAFSASTVAPERTSDLRPRADAERTPPAGTYAQADGELSAQRDAPLGGQAVIEGVMMRGVRHWAVAVRKPAAPSMRVECRRVLASTRTAALAKWASSARSR